MLVRKTSETRLNYILLSIFKHLVTMLCHTRLFFNDH